MGANLTWPVDWSRNRQWELTATTNLGGSKMQKVVQANGTCILHNCRHIVKCDAEGYNRWQNGELIQLALPGMTSEEREILISGNCDESWNALMDWMDD